MVGILEFTVRGRTDLSVPLRDGDRLVIGRGPDADVSFVNFKGLTRRHCWVWAEGGQAWIEDMRSYSGTFVNLKSIRGPCVLRLGDEVWLQNDLTFRLQPCPGTPTAEAESPTPANQSEEGAATSTEEETEGTKSPGSP
jgi:pSer/pThr/pTyr-binding forkhead associated (FHA) protein